MIWIENRPWIPETRLQKEKTHMRSSVIGIVTLSVVGLVASAAEPSELKDSREKFSYSLGMSLGTNLKRSGLGTEQVDIDLIFRGLKDVTGGSPTLLSETEMRQVIMDYQREMRTQLGAKNKDEGAKFLAENKSKEGVKIKTVTVGTNTYELQYEVLTPGSGQSPTTNDMVTVNYRGTLIDGTEFDSSYKRGQPATFPVTGVIRGWTEALQLMQPGAKWKLAIPSDLAYGERGNANIGPNATLVFEVELISAQPRQSTPKVSPPQPVTSDIIKVPSKEELEKGAKIEVIKAADLEKMQAAEKAKAEAEKAKNDTDKK